MGRSKSTSLPVRKVHTNIQDSHLCEKGKANLAGYQLYGTWLRFCAVEKLKVVSLKQTQLPTWPCSNQHDSNKMHKTLWIRAIPWLVLNSTLIWWIVTNKMIVAKRAIWSGMMIVRSMIIIEQFPLHLSLICPPSSSQPSNFYHSATSTTMQRLPQSNFYHNATSATVHPTTVHHSLHRHPSLLGPFSSSYRDASKKKDKTLNRKGLCTKTNEESEWKEEADQQLKILSHGVSLDPLPG